MNPVLYMLVFYLLKIHIFGVAFDPYLFLTYAKSNLKLNDVSVPQHLSYSVITCA